MNSPASPPRDDWEAWLEQQLRQLPNRPAPASLAPRVMAAVAARVRRPWYARPWLEWPRPWQAVSALAISLVLGMLAYALLHFRELAAPEAWGAWLQVSRAPLDALGAAGQVLFEALERLTGRISPWVWTGFGMLAAIMYATCVGLGTLIYRLAIRHSATGRRHENR